MTSVWNRGEAYSLEVSVNNVQVVDAPQAFSDRHKLLPRSISLGLGLIEEERRRDVGMRTRLSLPTLGSFLRYCLRSRLSTYS